MVADHPSRALAELLPDRAKRVFFGCLSSMLDQFTVSRLVQAGVPLGGHCLVVGRGSDSIARWLADAVGPNGDATTVPTTDHVPIGTFDLIYCRLALAHMPTPGQALAAVAGLLPAGGVLVIEEWLWSGKVLTATDSEASMMYERYQHALVTMLTAEGTDLRWADRVPAAMLDTGLVGVDVAAYARSWAGDTPGAMLDMVIVGELRERLIAAGADPDHLDDLHALLARPDLLLLSNLTVSTLGRRARVAGAVPPAARPRLP